MLFSFNKNTHSRARTHSQSRERFLCGADLLVFFHLLCVPFSISLNIGHRAKRKEISTPFFVCLFVWPVHSKYNNHDYCYVMKVFFILYYIIRLFVFVLISIRIDTHELSRFDFSFSLPVSVFEDANTAKAEPPSHSNTLLLWIRFSGFPAATLFRSPHQDQPISMCCKI